MAQSEQNIHEMRMFEKAIRAAIPDTDAATEYLRMEGFHVMFAGIDKYGTPYYAVSKDGGKLILHNSQDVTFLARNHMENQP